MLTATATTKAMILMPPAWLAITRSSLFLFSHIKFICQMVFLSGSSLAAEVGWTRSADDDLVPAVPVAACICCCDSCGVCSEPTFAVAVGGAARGFSAGAAGAGLGAGETAGFDRTGGTGLGGGAFARALPYLYRWNIPAKTSITMPTIKSEKFFMPCNAA